MSYTLRGTVIERSSLPRLSNRACPCGASFTPNNTQAVYCPQCNTSVEKVKRRRAQRQMHRVMEHRIETGQAMRPKTHETVVAFKPIWEVVRGEALRSRNLEVALRRAGLILQQSRLPRAAQETILWACRYRLTEGPDAHLVGTSPRRRTPAVGAAVRLVIHGGPVKETP